ncbi:hypothetical protein [Cupriavidus sp. EM10]|uniref:hypothetical protein n=1 Tax=Cupriavidus sp. EM10 TaxID=2839983 RepID=UPI001C003510|nr:hypothetical protein [Cupriavidus sp. EM10]QWE98151.1 hypothetical protein KLP38_28525 [Cupriavidus sp. EM10]
MNGKTYIVDMNVLQRAEFAERIEIETTATFVLPDVAFVEMCKSEKCELTMRRALKVFASHTERVAAAISVSQALRTEMAKRTPVSRDGILSPEFASIVRKLIADLASSELDKADEIQKTYGRLRSALRLRDLNPALAKDLTAQKMKTIQRGLPKPFFSAIRKSAFPRARFQDLLHVMTDIFARKHMTNVLGMSDAEARTLMRERAITVRYEYLLLRHCMLTLKRGGDISGAKAETELNHHLDMDYVALGSYFDGVLSYDHGVNDAMEDLQNFLSTPVDEARTRIGPWFEELASSR